jgi:DNA-binding response OmpR family regulator
MRYPKIWMPVVFAIATDWKLQTAVHTGLRERGINALEMESLEDVQRVIASGDVPAAVVLDATAEYSGEPALQRLVARVPTILIASRTETVQLPQVAGVFYRPVSVAEIAEKVSELLARGQNA